MLESLIFLVEKKDGRIKARHCANGSKQRNWIDPEDAASPTVMTDSILLTAGIEAKENRDVATWDIVGHIYFRNFMPPYYGLKQDSMTD